MTGYRISLAVFASALVLTCASSDDSLKSVITVPDATKQLLKDQIGEPKKYTMPAGCVSSDKKSIERGAFFFHNLSGSTVKGKNADRAKSLDITIKSKHKELMEPYGGWKPYGNCVACHNTPNAIGAGNIGPDLTGYTTWGRSDQFIYQKVADPRIDNPMTHMPIGLTTGKLFNEKEVCDIVSYLKTL